MKFKLRDYFIDRLLILCLILGIVSSAALIGTVYLSGQEQPKPLAEEKPTQVKTWKLPEYMQENLQRMLEDFNKKFEEKVQTYKKELKTRFVEFKDMPDNVVLYLEGGIFITRSDYLNLQEQLRDKLNEKPKKEVKGDDKTTN